MDTEDSTGGNWTTRQDRVGVQALVEVERTLEDCHDGAGFVNPSMPAAESKCLVDRNRKRMRMDRSARERQVAKGHAQNGGFVRIFVDEWECG